MRTIILLAVATASAVATVCAQEHGTGMPHDRVLLVTPERWLASPSTCLELTPPEWCGPSTAVVPFAGEQPVYDLHEYDLHELCGHVFYERLALHGPAATEPVRERIVVPEEISVVWAGDPAASICAQLDTGTGARYLLVDDLAGSSPRRLLPETSTSAGLGFLTATHTTAHSLPHGRNQ